nr:MAG TPA: hypothetical protein [Crassvirales sp.]
MFNISYNITITIITIIFSFNYSIKFIIPIRYFY